MRAATLTDVGEIGVEEHDRPEPLSNEVLLQVGACGVCMTDYHMYHGSFEVETPQVLGHESAGTVVEVGSEVTGVERGDRVAMNPTVPCNACQACKRGDTHLCENNTSIGGAGERIMDGAFAEYVRVPHTCVVDIGDLPFREAALAEPLACCIHGADRSGITQGGSVALIGAGPIGLLLLQTLRNRGASPIVVSEIDEKRRQLATKMGADEVIDPIERDPVTAVQETVGTVSTAIEVIGKVETIQQAQAITADGGTTLIFGVPAQDATMNIDPFDVFFDELDIRGSYSLTQASFERAVTLLQGKRIDADSLVSDEIGLTEIPAAFDRMGDAEGLKTVVVP